MRVRIRPALGYPCEVISAAFEQALAGRYRIERELGSGGMAAVYLADDLRHRRRVAIKIMHPEIAAALGHDRFAREIDIAAQLTHPHIVTLLDSGVVDGQPYYVMSFIDGESLRDRLNREKQLPLDEVLRLTDQIGQALDYAHRTGVVHRDIKPENILICEGHALVMDFGIAKPVAAASPTLTTGTTLLGTPAYMSPEQWMGSAASLDGRSDLYSLACVVYEMLAGQPPFTGVSSEIIAHQHLSLAPPLVSNVRAAVPVAMARSIQHALAKAAADRPSSVTAFVAELGGTARIIEGGGRAGPSRATVLVASLAVVAIMGVVAMLLRQATVPSWAGVKQNSIAVLPLEDINGDPGQSYFAAGMTDELITDLAKISSLTVISNSATSTYRNTRKAPARIGHELSVRFLLEGSVVRAQGRVRIATRLIEASTGRNLWAERYERDLQDVFGLQSEVAIAVAQQIQARLTPGERASLVAPRDISPEAHDLYLKARFSIDTSTREGTQRSIQLLKQALGLEPGYALAYASLASNYYLMSGWYLPPAEAMPLAREYATKALALDSTLAEGLTIRGMVTYHYEWKFESGLALLRRAVDLNPGSALARQWYAYALNGAGRYSESRAEFARARELDPVSEQLQWFATWPWYYERRYDKAVEELNKNRMQDANFWPTYSLLGEAHEALGNLALAREELQKARDLGGNPWVVAALARVAAAAGRTEEARGILRQLEAGRDTTYIQPYALASVYARLGDHDAAFELLEQSIRGRDEDITMLSIDPRMDPLRRDPRYAELLRRVGLKQ